MLINFCIINHFIVFQTENMWVDVRGKTERYDFIGCHLIYFLVFFHFFNSRTSFISLLERVCFGDRMHLWYISFLSIFLKQLNLQ